MEQLINYFNSRFKAVKFTSNLMVHPKRKPKLKNYKNSPSIYFSQINLILCFFLEKCFFAFIYKKCRFLGLPMVKLLRQRRNIKGWVTWLLTIENRIYREELKESLGMNFFSPFQPEREFKVYKSCKCSQIMCIRVH